MGVGDSRSEAEEAVEAQVGRARDALGSSDENALARWVLISGNRWAIVLVALSLVWLGLIILGAIWTDEFFKLFTETSVVQTLFFTLLSGIILLVSIAVSINAVVISQEITPLGDQQEQIEETLSFRDTIMTQTETDVSPARPAEFLRVILWTARTNAEELRDSVGSEDPEFREQATILADHIVTQVETVEKRLKEGSFGTSDVLLAGINYDYSWQVYAARRLQAEHNDVLTDTQRETIDDLVTVLKYFTIGREYFKTLYFKREMGDLSRWLLVVAFPTIVFLSYAILALRARLWPDVTLFGMPTLVLFVSFVYTIGLVPYTLFSSYVFRTATIANRTLAGGPFILKSDDRRGKIDWESDESRDP